MRKNEFFTVYPDKTFPLPLHVYTIRQTVDDADCIQIRINGRKLLRVFAINPARDTDDLVLCVIRDIWGEFRKSNAETFEIFCEGSPSLFESAYE